MIIEELKKLPKVELHCHLDGSLSRQFLEKRLGRTVGEEEIHVSDDCRSLQEYLEKFNLPGQCIQDAEGLREAGYDVLRQMKEENICYAEIRFAPLLSTLKGLGVRRIIEALSSGMEQGKADFGVEYGIITCAMRHHSQEENAKMLKISREYLGKGVCGAGSCRSRGDVSDVRIYGIIQNGKEDGSAIYLACRRVWKSEEYQRFRRCGST